MFMSLLPPEHRRRVRDAGVGTVWRRGDHLMYQGATHDAIHILEHGWVKVWAVEDEQERVLDILGPGELLGELEMIGGVSRLCWITALQEVRATTISPDRFRLIVTEQPEILWAVLQTVIIKFRDEHEQRMQFDGHHRAHMLLARLADRYGHQQDDGFIIVPIPITRGILASWARLSATTCGRLLRATFGTEIHFRSDGLTFRRDRIKQAGRPLHMDSGEVGRR